MEARGGPARRRGDTICCRSPPLAADAA